jgi:hypothetical protein
MERKKDLRRSVILSEFKIVIGKETVICLRLQNRMCIIGCVS